MKLVVFDLDGTLLNTIEDLTIAMNVGLTAGNLPAITPEQFRDIIAHGTGRLSARTCGQSQGLLYDTVSQNYYKYYQQNFSANTRPYDGIMDMLHYLVERGVTIAVFSGKDDKPVKQLCQQHFGDIVQWAIGKYDDVFVKPNAYGLVDIMNRCGADSTNTIFVGDTTIDIDTAASCGVPCVCVDWGYNDKCTLVEQGATHIASSAEQLIDILSTM